MRLRTRCISLPGMKVICIISGTVFLILGILGIFLPLLPTTPFLLLTAALYMRGSDRMYGWLLTNRYLGFYITNYRNKRAMTRNTKILSLSLLWISLLLCIFVWVDPLWVKIVLAVVLAGVTVHILSFRTMEKSEEIKMVRVRTAAEIEKVAALANQIWHEHYATLISAAQIDYMLAELQSAPAITRQMSEEGYEYYLIDADGNDVGYMGLRQGDGKMMLSKMYILADKRGRGYAREAFDYIENLCLRRGLKAVWLTVNRNNTGSVDVYRKRGFEVVREEVADIGGGFVMDDYIMEKRIK